METAQLNELFLDTLGSNPENMEKVSEHVSSYIRTRLREVSFSRKILNPLPVTKADLQASTQHDGLVKLVSIEPDSFAVKVTMRGLGGYEYAEGQRVEIPFSRIASPRFEKIEDELLAYDLPLLQVIEQNSLLDIHAMEDEMFIGLTDAAISATSKTEDVTALNSVSGQIDKRVFVALFNLLENSGNTGTVGTHSYEARRYETDCILMNRADYNKFLSWKTNEGGGDDFAKELLIDGFNYHTFNGKKLVVTNKGELVPPGTMYAFAPKEFLGHSYILYDTKAFIKKEFGKISWEIWESLGMGIVNAFGCAKVTWTN